ncbi:hypothetical protein CIFRMM300M2_24100 [Citrobacter freundii]
MERLQQKRANTRPTPSDVLVGKVLILLAVPLHDAETQLLFAEQDAECGDWCDPLRNIPAASRNKQDIAGGKHLIDARIRKFTFQHNFQPGKIDLIRQFRRCAIGAGEINLPQRRGAVNQAGEKMADVVIHVNPLQAADRETVTLKTIALK